MKENKTKPDIRFKGFTEAWEQRKLGEIVGIYDGVHQTPKYQDSGIMFLSVENISTLQSTKYISEEDFKRDYKVYPQENDILMTRIGDVGTTNVVTDNTLKAYYVSLALLKYKNTNPYFLSNAMQSNYVQKGLANRTLKTAVPMKINKDEIGKVDVILTAAVEEQSKIGSYFKNLDNFITLHQRECDQLKELKKSMLKKMFPRDESSIPEVRFAGFTDAWEQRKLGDICSEIGDGLHSAPTYDNNGEYYFINGNNLVNGHIEIDELETKRVSSYTFASNDKCLDEKTVLLSINGTIGNLAYYAGEKVMLGKSAAYLKVKDIKKEFLYTSLQTEMILNNFMLSLTGTTIKNLGLEAIKKTSILIPGYDEQTKISKHFNDLDNLITLHQRELEILKNLKKTCLKRMFI